MEYRVGGNEVLITHDKAYVAEDDSALLQQVSRFKPFVDYLTTFKPQTFTISVFTVTTVQAIAGRLSSVSGRLTLRHKASKELIEEPITFSESTLVVVLPIITVEAAQYAVLVQRPRIAVGGTMVTEAFTGHFSKDGAFVSENGDLLKALGMHVTEKTCIALTNDELSIGHEGQAPVKLLRHVKAFTQQSLDDALSGNIVGEGGSSVKVVPLDHVAEITDDLKTRVAASLIARSNRAVPN